MTRDTLEEGVFDYQFLFETVEDGVLLAGEDGAILDVNPGACHILQRRREDVRVAVLEEILDPSDPRLGPALEERRSTGRFWGELRMLSRDGRSFPAEVSIVGYQDKTGRGGIGIVFRDVTERKRVEEVMRQHIEELEYQVEERAVGHEAAVAELKNKERMLREVEERYHMLTEEIGDGVWDWDVSTGVLHWNDRLFETLGLSCSGSTPTFEEFVELVHPEDRRQIVHMIAAGPEHDVPFTAELRLRHSTGEYRYCITHVKAQRGQDGALLRVVGIVVDVTERKQVEEELRESEEKFWATFDQATVGIAHVGTEGRWLRVNQKLCEIVGYSREALLGKTSQDITYTNDLDVDLEQVRRLLAGDAESYSTKKRYVRKDRSQVWVNLTVSLGRKLSGEPNYFVFIIEDITERKQAESVSETLTPREIEVLRLLAQGNTNKQIAESMMFSQGTAKINVQHIMTKLGVKNRTQAILRAVEIGLISPSSRRP